MSSHDLPRRRMILLSAIGSTVRLKRCFATKRSKLYGRAGRLVDVRRTMATVDFHEGDRFDAPSPALLTDDERDLWDIPISQLLLPGSVEPLPGQRELLPEAAK